ncbi:hypothetical protein SNEBB_007760 [Seison nebaliae]|nr:hypothetical protein SNEBB_007760 [Seison nebaliae]
METNNHNNNDNNNNNIDRSRNRVSRFFRRLIRRRMRTNLSLLLRRNFKENHIKFSSTKDRYRRRKTFHQYLPTITRIYSCSHCRTHLANHEDLISKSFQGSQGRAYLFRSVVNIKKLKAEERLLLTGLHSVADIHCGGCNSTLGWKYEKAFELNQRYKEGKYVIEMTQMIKDNNWEENESVSKIVPTDAFNYGNYTSKCRSALHIPERDGESSGRFSKKISQNRISSEKCLTVNNEHNSFTQQQQQQQQQQQYYLHHYHHHHHLHHNHYGQHLRNHYGCNYRSTGDVTNNSNNDGGGTIGGNYSTSTQSSTIPLRLIENRNENRSHLTNYSFTPPSSYNYSTGTSMINNMNEYNYMVNSIRNMKLLERQCYACSRLFIPSVNMRYSTYYIDNPNNNSNNETSSFNKFPPNNYLTQTPSQTLSSLSIQDLPLCHESLFDGNFMEDLDHVNVLQPSPIITSKSFRSQPTSHNKRLAVGARSISDDNKSPKFVDNDFRKRHLTSSLNNHSHRNSSRQNYLTNHLTYSEIDNYLMPNRKNKTTKNCFSENSSSIYHLNENDNRIINYYVSSRPSSKVRLSKNIERSSLNNQEYLNNHLLSLIKKRKFDRSQSSSSIDSTKLVGLNKSNRQPSSHRIPKRRRCLSNVTTSKDNKSVGNTKSDSMTIIYGECPYSILNIDT